jgi:transposase InsO family protein
MNSTVNKESLVCAVREASKNGARLTSIATMLDISVRTIERWFLNPRRDGRRGSVREVKHRLTEEERKEILRVANLSQFRDLTPAEIVAILAENGQFLASERSIYRVLKQHNQLGHRGPGKKSEPRVRPSHVATGPGQLLSWDITYLHTNIRGIFFYLYLVIDVWSRKIVAWEIHAEETSELSATMMDRLSHSMDMKGTVIHADNGGPMKGATMLMKLHDLGVTASFSRPRVSEDNPFSEALFKTLKYRPDYPRMFATLADARKWVADFVHWYNHEHRHSGIGYVTPEERHSGLDRRILEKRAETFRNAKAQNPLRWSRGTKKWEHQAEVVLGKSKAA